MASIMRRALDRRTKITKSAFEKVRANSGHSNYHPLEVYEKMKPEDFAKMVERYGMDNTVKYIRAMENHRMRGKNG